MATLIANVPYNRLRPGLLSRIIVIGLLFHEEASEVESLLTGEGELGREDALELHDAD